MSKLPILMYHHVHLHKGEGLTIRQEQLEAQFKYLSEKGYKTYHCSELLDLSELDSKKNILITFDDAYVNQLELAYPLLQKYNLKATFFIPLQFLGKTDEWNTPSFPIMTSAQLKSLDSNVVELAFHSYAHQKYNELCPEQIAQDIKNCFEVVSENALPLSQALAYPYGKYPREFKEKTRFVNQLKEHKFKFGLRIGNRINNFPFKNPFEIQRIDVKGKWNLSKFKRKIKYGKIF